MARAILTEAVPLVVGVGLLRNSWRPLKAGSVVPLSLSRHCRAGLSDSAATRLGRSLSHRHALPSSFVTASLVP